jgi:hypothetical protein
MWNPGTCRHCGCREADPCRLASGDTCGWIDKTRSVCSNPGCVKAETVRRAAIAAPRPRRPTSADIHRLICGRKGSRKRARSTAA